MKENGKTLHRHNINDTLWEKIRDLLPGGAGKQGGLSEPALQTEIYHLNTVIGKTPTEDFSAGGI
jgi:hypothetical protein